MAERGMCKAQAVEKGISWSFSVQGTFFHLSGAEKESQTEGKVEIIKIISVHDRTEAREGR